MPDSFPPLSDDTKKAKRNMMAFASASTVAWSFSIKITKLPVAGLELTAAESVMFTILCVSTAYFFVAWVIYAWDDHRVWHSPLKRVQRVREQTFLYSEGFESAKLRIAEALNHWPYVIEQQTRKELAERIVMIYVPPGADEVTKEYFERSLAGMGLSLTAQFMGQAQQTGLPSYTVNEVYDELFDIFRGYLKQRERLAEKVIGPHRRGDATSYLLRNAFDNVVPAFVGVVGIVLAIFGILDVSPTWFKENKPAFTLPNFTR